MRGPRGNIEEGSRNVYNTVSRRALSPWRPCASVTADVHGCPSRSCTDQVPSRDQGHPGGAHGRSNDSIASPCHGMRCPPVHPLFASWAWLLHTRCSLEAIDMTVHERNHERGDSRSIAHHQFSACKSGGVHIRIYDCICPEACSSIREPLDSAGGSIYVPAPGAAGVPS
jgi:hypothetical protein